MSKSCSLQEKTASEFTIPVYPKDFHDLKPGDKMR